MAPKSGKKNQRATASGRASRNPPPNPQARAKPRKTRNGSNPLRLVSALDAAVPMHLPGPRACARYVVHRTKTDVNVSAAATDLVLVLGDFLKNESYQGGENRLSPAIGIYGFGTNVPGTTETSVPDPFLNGLSSDSYSLSLHNLTLEVRCTGTSGGLVPPGLVYLGVPSVGFDRTAYGTWGTLATSFKTKPGMHRFTAYECLQKARRASSFPLDPVKFSEFRYNHGTYETTDEFGGALAPIVFILDGNGTATSWTLTVHAEWRMRSNANPVIQSMERSHKPSSEDTWHKVSNALSAVGGVINQGVQLSQTIGSVIERFGSSAGGRMAQLALEVD